MSDKQFQCDNCKDDTINTLYEGWFYTNQKFNEFAQGTASAGLLQLRTVCKNCLDGPLKEYWKGNVK